MTRFPDIIVFSTADWNWPYWTNKQHTAAGLAARGHRVLFVESVGIRRPTPNRADVGRLWTRLRSGLAPIKAVNRNLSVYSPLTIPAGREGGTINNFNQRILCHGIGRWAAQTERPLIWTYHPFMLRTADVLGYSRLIYHCVDDLGQVPGIDREAFYAAEARLLDKADLVFTTSHQLQERCAAIAGDRSHYLGNVADIEHFAVAREKGTLPPEIAAIPEPRLGYVGVLSDFKIDFGMLETLATEHRDWHFVFIGEEREGQRSEAIARMKQQPNAHFLGWKPYEQLPRYLSGLSVGLLPQLINEYTRAMFPMKFFEYIAAGLPVVSTPLPALRDFQSLYQVGNDVVGFANAITTVLSGNGSSIPAPHDPILQNNSWAVRLERMLALIEATA